MNVCVLLSTLLCGGIWLGKADMLLLYNTALLLQVMLSNFDIHRKMFLSLFATLI